MNKEQLVMLMELTGEDAKTLFDAGEKQIYFKMRRQLASLRQDGDVMLNLNQMRFFWYLNHV